MDTTYMNLYSNHLDLRNAHPGNCPSGLLGEYQVTRDYYEDKTAVIAWCVIAAFLVLGTAYIAWLDQGCTLVGVITAHGRVCVN